MNPGNKRRTIKYAWSLIVDQFVAVLAATIVINIVLFFIRGDSSLLRILIGGFVFAAICYIDAWGKGSDDYNRAKTGIIKSNAFYGFVFGFIAIIPSILIALFAFLAETGVVSFYQVLGEDIFTMINRFWQLPLSSLFVFVNESPALNLAIPFFVPVISGLGYFLGFRGIMIKKILVFENSLK